MANQVAPPIFSPASGTFSGNTVVTITSATPGASIFYTLDGSTPTARSNLYTAPIHVSATTTLAAIAVLADSIPTTATYTAIDCITSTLAWQSKAIPAQTGNFQVDFDATPNTAAMDGVFAFSTSPVTAYSQVSFGGRFHTTGTIDAISGGGYTAGPVYLVGAKYHFNIKVTAGTATVTVTSPTGVTTIIGAAPQPFRQASTSISSFSLVSEIGSVTVCNIAVSPLVITPPPPPPPPPPPTHKVTLAWSGVGPFNVYKSPTTAVGFTKIASSLPGNGYTDTPVSAGLKLFYVVTALDSAGDESAFSNEVAVTVPTP